MLLNVKTVADWLFVAVVEQQAAGFVREKAQNLVTDIHYALMLWVSKLLVSYSTHLVQGWWTVEYMDSCVRIPAQLWTCTNQTAVQEVKSVHQIK